MHREDRHDHPEFLTPTRRYVTGIGVSAAVVFASAFLPDGPRLVVWACVAIGWIGGMLALGHPAVGLSRGLRPTESLVERFGLFTIIVLGEVVFGVVDGLSASERDVKTITTGMIALVIGFGFWWIYFDLVGRRPPRPDGGALASWLLSHLPITLSITAAGAAMVSLIAHAHDARTPASTAWLLAGAVAVGLLALIVTTRALADAERLARRLSTGGPGDGRRRRRGRGRRLGSTGPVAVRAPARRDPLAALVLRRQPVPPRRRLGRRAVAPAGVTSGRQGLATKTVSVLDRAEI